MTDAGGNITTYTWTDDNQLAAVTLPNSCGTVTNTYDGDGLRFSRTDANGTNSYLWNGQVLEAELGNGNTVSAWYTQGVGDGQPATNNEQRTTPSGEFGDIISTRDVAGSATSWPQYDASGNVSQTTDSGAGITTTLAYDTFGVVTDNSGPASPTVAWQGKQGYQFEPTLGPAGLQYVRQRWYDPATRQFISPDPLGFAGGDVNLFRYAGNNPVNRNDPGGKQNWPQGIAVSDDTLTALMLGEVAMQLRANSPHADALASGYMNELQGVDRDILHTLEQSSASLAPFNPQHPAIGQAVRAALGAFGPTMQQVLRRAQRSYVPLTTAQLHTDYLWAHRHEVQIPTLVAQLHRDLLEVQTVERFLKLGMHAEGPHSKLPNDLHYLHATEALLKATIGFVGHRWSAYQHQQNAFQGGYFQSEESDIQGLITAMRMIPGGQSAWDILQDHPGYAAGWAALDVVGLGGEELVTHGTTLLGRGLSAGASAALRPAFGAIGRLGPILPYRQRLTFGVRLSRLFLTATEGYAKVAESPIMAALLRHFPSLREWDWEQGHVFIQQRWFREGGPNAWYSTVNESDALRGLRRAGNAGWNLLPMPRWLNQYLAMHPNAALGFGLSVPVTGGASVAGSWYLGRYIHHRIFDGQ